MPVYEYACSMCGRVAEERRGFDERARRDVCGAQAAPFPDGAERKCSGIMSLRVSVPSPAVVVGGTGAQRAG